jgi:hypothetical protein
MVARLKLKGIDGRAPQGVNSNFCLAAKLVSAPVVTKVTASEID